MLSRCRVPWFRSNPESIVQRSEVGHLSRSDKIVRQTQEVAQANIIWRYGLAVLAVAAAAGLRLASHRVLGLQVPYWSFTLAVMVAAWVGGRGPSLVATALSALVATWLFIAPTHSFAIAESASAWGLGLFVITAAPLGLMIVSLRDALLAERESEARLEFVLNAASMGVWDLDLISHRVWRSPQHNAIFGYPAALPEWTYETFLGHVLPEDREGVERTFRLALSRGTDFELEYRIRRVDGAVRWIWDRGRIQGYEKGRPARFSGLMRDITERKEAEERLRASEERLRLAQQVARLGTFEWDIQTGVDRWTPELEALYGLPPGGFAGTEQAWEELVHPADRAEAVRRVQQCLDTGGTFDAEWRVIQPDGSERWLFGRSRVFKDDSGRLLRLIGANMDITERKQAEERLRQAQKLESIGLLAGGIAHDFNNLLTVIIGNADFARTKYPSSEELQHIITASERAAHLTSQLLAYAGKGQFISKTFSLNEVVSGSAELLSVSISKRDVELSFNLSPEEMLIKGDPRQIEQVLMNLVINASESISPQADGRIEVTTSGCEVIPETLIRNAQEYDVQPGRFVCLEVTDNGSGMDEATLAKIFDPFFSTKFTGRGLGLPAVQGIVRSCRGFIDVHSLPGAGSTFRVFLPASAEKTAEAIPAGARPGTSGRRDRRPAVVLVVDDEEMVRGMACTALRSQGHEVLEANNGKDALDVLAGAATLPALVLLDLKMPVMGGAELVPILNHDHPGLRVIVTSGYSEEDARKDLPPGAIADFLQKPYTLSTLFEKVDRILNSGGSSEKVRTAA